MTSKLRKTLLAVLTAFGLVLAVLAAIFMAACDDKDGSVPDSVTLRFMNGTEVYAEFSGKPGSGTQSVADPEPAYGYVFEGWSADSQNAEAKSAPSVFPKKDTTYYAKFVKIPDEATVLTFINGSQLHALRYGDAGDAYEAPAAPAAASGLRFDGWAVGSSLNAVTGLPAVLPAQDLVFYAKFSQISTAKHEYKDILGGEDVIEVDGETVTMTRRYAEKQTTTNFKPATGYFCFDIGGFKLEGVVQPSLNGFYYFKDLVATEYKGQFNEAEKIEFTGDDKMKYTDADGNVVNGNFSVDPISGDFAFNSATDYFVFRIDKATNTFDKATGSERGYYVLEMENGFEFLLLDGFPLYTLDDGKPQFVKNSGTAYSYNYNPLTGRFLTRLSANYTLDATVVQYEQYTLAMTDYDTSCRITREFKNCHGYDVCGDFVPADAYAGRFFNKSIVTSQTSPDLILDGYGRANYKSRRGDYEAVETPVYSQYSASAGITDYSEVIIRYTPDNPNDSERLFRLESGEYGLVYMELDDIPPLVECENLCEDVFQGRIETFTYMAMYFYTDEIVYVWSFIDDVEYGKVYDIADMGTVTDLGNGEYRYTSYYLSQVGSEGDKFLFSFDFKYNQTGDKIICGNTFMTADEETVAEGDGFKLVTDKYGKLTYTTFGPDKTVQDVHVLDKNSYKYYPELEEGRFAVYELDFGGGDGAIILMSEFNDTTYKYDKAELLPYSDYSQLIYHISVAQTNYDSMMLIKGSGDDYTKALIKISYYISGTYEQGFGWIEGNLTKEGDLYTFTLTDPEGFIITNFGEDFEYKSFGFKIDAEAKANGKYLYHDGYEKTYTIDDTSDTLELDGYGRGKLTTVDGQAERTVVNVTYIVTDGLLEVTTEAGDQYFYYFDGTAQDKIHASAEEGGVYVYAYVSDGTLSFSTTAVFLGNNKVVYTTTSQRYEGTYEVLESTIEDFFVPGTWTEYKLTLTEIDPEEGPAEEEVRYIAVLRDLELEGGLTVNVFSPRFYDPGEYEIAELDENGALKKEEGAVKVIGSLSGNGYSDAAYVTDSVTRKGEMTVGNFLNESTNPESNFVTTANGTSVYFTYVADDNMYDMMLFDKKVDGGKTYLVARPFTSGTYQLYGKGSLDEKQSLALDGYGKAVYKNDAQTVNGTYDTFAADGEYNYQFSADEGGTKFTFYVAVVRSGNEYRNVFVRHDANTLYTNSSKEAIDLDVEGTATYIDRYGEVYEGNYSYLTPKLLGFQEVYGEYYGELMIFDVVEENKTFERNADTFVIENGVLLAYQGPAIIYGELKIPDGVKEIGPNVFRTLGGIRSIQIDKLHSTPATIDFNEVEIIGDYAFYDIPGLSVSVLKSDKVTSIGDYAFYSHAYNEYFYAINTIDMPNLETVGEYAFYGCNQLSLGCVTLSNIQNIGAYAFAHNTFISGEKMKLDLTGMTVEKINALTIDENAFANTYSGVDDDNTPLDIYVNTDAEKSALTTKLNSVVSGFVDDVNRVIHVGAIPAEPEG